MAHVTPLSEDQLSDELKTLLVSTKERFGFIPNSLKTLARRPEIALGAAQLFNSINGPSRKIPAELASMVAQICSKSAGCQYCQAHTAHTSEGAGVETEKEMAIWEYETSPLYTDAERAALRVAQAAGQVPNAVTAEDMAALKKHYSDEQIVEIVAVISMFGFLNRWNDTMATDLEDGAFEAGQRFLADKGWSAGKHRVA